MKTPRFMTVLVATVVLAIAGCGSDDSETGGAVMPRRLARPRPRAT